MCVVGWNKGVWVLMMSVVCVPFFWCVFVVLCIEWPSLLISQSRLCLPHFLLLTTATPTMDKRDAGEWRRE